MAVPQDTALGSQEWRNASLLKRMAMLRFNRMCDAKYDQQCRDEPQGEHFRTQWINLGEAEKQRQVEDMRACLQLLVDAVLPDDVQRVGAVKSMSSATLSIGDYIVAVSAFRAMLTAIIETDKPLVVASS